MEFQSSAGSQSRISVGSRMVCMTNARKTDDPRDRSVDYAEVFIFRDQVVSFGFLYNRSSRDDWFYINDYCVHINSQRDREKLMELSAYLIGQ